MIHALSSRRAPLGAGLLALALAFGAPRAASAADTFAIDGAHSAVVFAVKHLGVSRTFGSFTKISGKLELDASMRQGAIQLEIDAASLFTANKKRDDHLRGPDFFKTKEFPTITFVGKTTGKQEGDTFEIGGELTLLGKTKSVTLHVQHIGSGKDPWGGFRTGYEAKLIVKRSEFGMNYMPDAIGDEVELTIAIEAIKQG